MSSPTRVSLRWTGGLSFEASNPRGSRIPMASGGEAGLAPTEALLAAVAGCMAVDIVTILEKMRLPLSELSAELRGERAEEPPRYFRCIEMVFHAKGEASRERLEHAVALSLDKYCSVFHSLRRDMEVKTEVRLES